MWQLNHQMWEKKHKGTIECDKSTITCDVSTTQCEDGTIKCEKKLREPLNVTKVQLHVMLVHYTMWGWYNQMWEKKKGTTKCDKSTITCDFDIAQFEDSSIKC